MAEGDKPPRGNDNNIFWGEAGNFGGGKASTPQKP